MTDIDRRRAVLGLVAAAVAPLVPADAAGGPSPVALPRGPYVGSCADYVRSDLITSLKFAGLDLDPWQEDAIRRAWEELA